VCKGPPLPHRTAGKDEDSGECRLLTRSMRTKTERKALSKKKLIRLSMILKWEMKTIASVTIRMMTKRDKVSKTKTPIKTIRISLTDLLKILRPQRKTRATKNKKRKCRKIRGSLNNQ
jgi:hypothetical protein